MIAEAIAGGDRVQGTSMYISITQCGLTEAQEFIRTLTAELRSKVQQKEEAKQAATVGFWKRLLSLFKH